jgi:hypothetical protein
MSLAFHLLLVTQNSLLFRQLQRQIASLFPPLFRQLGGAPHGSRRLLRHKIRNSAALLVSPAVHFGGNFLNSANLRHSCHHNRS